VTDYYWFIPLPLTKGGSVVKGEGEGKRKEKKKKGGKREEEVGNPALPLPFLLKKRRELEIIPQGERKEKRGKRGGKGRVLFFY